MSRLLRGLFFLILFQNSLPVFGQVGQPETFDVATWNIEWFGSATNGPFDDERQVDNVRDIIASSGIELWAVQEIANTARFSQLLTELGSEWSGELATNSGAQRIGFIWDTRTVVKRSIRHVLESFSSEFAGRPPLQGEFGVTLPDTSLVVTAINVHMKAFGDASSYQRRVNAAQRIKNHIDFSSLSSASVIFLGDLNDELIASTYANQISPYQIFIDDPDDYLALTLPLDQNNTATWVGSSNGSTLDHILISSELAPSVIPGTVSTLDSLRSVIGYTVQTSDHLPVHASFGKFVSTKIAENNVIPGTGILSLYPIPATDQINLVFDADGSDSASLQISDILGRIVIQSRLQLPRSASGQIKIDVSELPPGLFLLHYSDRTGSETRSFIVR